MNNAETIRTTYKAIRKKWLELSKNMSDQVQRVGVNRFVALETALVLSSHLTQMDERRMRTSYLKKLYEMEGRIWRKQQGRDDNYRLINELAF